MSPALPIDDAGLTRLHVGERDTIWLALSVHADAVLLDEPVDGKKLKDVD